MEANNDTQHSLFVRIAIERHDAIQRALLYFMSSKAIFWLAVTAGVTINVFRQNWIGAVAFLVIPLLRPKDGKGLPLTTATFECLLWLVVGLAFLPGLDYIINHGDKARDSFVGLIELIVLCVIQLYILADFFAPPRKRKKIKVPAIGRRKVEWGGEITS